MKFSRYLFVTTGGQDKQTANNSLSLQDYYCIIREFATTSARFLLLSVPLFLFYTDVKSQAGIVKGTPTFNCIGITWSGSGGDENTVCNVKYRVAGSNGPWQNGYPLWFDKRRELGEGTTAERPVNEYRGSIVGLRPGTTYQIELLAGAARNSLIVTTWSESFKIGTFVKVINGHNTLEITTSGTPGGYRLYSPGEGRSATIDVNNSLPNCVYINASYIIVRGLTLKGAEEDAILLGPDAHDVIIENNDISGWGPLIATSNNHAAVRIKGHAYDALNIERIIVQRNKIHHPRSSSNSWNSGGHPLGPNGINFEAAGGNHVIRYNDIYSDTAHYFMDGIGGGDNFTFEGFPNANSDIYGNKISQVYDDGIEAEGGNCNVRIWNNFTNYTFTGIACATTSIGPLYVFRNVSNVSQRSPVNATASVIDNEDRGPFNKCGSDDAQVRGGRTYLFHNTILQPTQSGFTFPRGMGGGPVDNGGPVRNVFSRNNIWQTFRTSTHPAIAEWQSGSNNGNSYDYDLYNGNIVVNSSGQEVHGIRGTPTYANPLSLEGPNSSGYFLTQASRGFDKGIPLNNFNDGYTGLAPDMGAYEAGKPALQFGVNGGNQPPVARTSNDLIIPSATSAVQLYGDISSDTDGVIVSYVWKQVSGPSALTISNASGSIATVSNLKPGIYMFELEVMDNNGATSAKTMKLLVEDNSGPKPTFVVYPNPASDLLRMQYVSRTKGKYIITIFDADMRLLWSKMIDKNELFMATATDISAYPQGVYFSCISSLDGKERSIVKFMKM